MSIKHNKYIQILHTLHSVPQEITKFIITEYLDIFDEIKQIHAIESTGFIQHISVIGSELYIRKNDSLIKYDLNTSVCDHLSLNDRHDNKAILYNGKKYVLNQYDKRVDVYNNDKLLSSFGHKQFLNPIFNHILVTDEKIIISDYYHIYIYDANYKFITMLQHVERNSYWDCTGLSSLGTILFVSDIYYNKIYMYDINTYEHINTLHIYDFSSPYGLAVYDNYVFVGIRSENNRIQIYSEKGQLVKIFDIPIEPVDIRIFDKKLIIMSKDTVCIYEIL